MGYTPEQLKALESQADQITAPSSSGSGYTPEQLAQLEAQADQISGRKPSTPGVLARVAQGLNVIPGTGRTLVRGGLDAVEGNFDRTKFRALLDKAIHGRAAPSSEMFDLSGLGTQNGYPPIFKPAVGFAMDAGMDATGPLLGAAARGIGAGAEGVANLGRLGEDSARALPTGLDNPLVEALRNGLAKIGMLSNPEVAQAAKTPVSSAVRAAGKSIFKSGYADLDKAVTSPSVPDPSDVLLELGIPSTERSVKSKVSGAIDNLSNKTSEIISKVSTDPTLQGGTIDPVNMDAAMNEARGTAADLSRASVDLPGVARAMPHIEAEAGKLNLTPSDAAYIAQRLRLAARNAYGAGGTTAPAEAQIYRDGARGIMDNLGEYISDIQPSTGKLYNDANHKLGSLIQAESVAHDVSTPMLDNIDTAGLAAAEVLKNPVAARMIVLKKGIEGALGRGGRTYGGYALERLGALGQQGAPGALGNVTPTFDTMLRQGYIHGESPWHLLPSTGGPDTTQGK